jgi:hypothetical protein
VAVFEFILQGVMKALNVNKLTRSGCVFKFWVADWFAQLNNKMGGDLKKIQTVGRYMIEVWKAVGMELDRVEFLKLMQGQASIGLLSWTLHAAIILLELSGWSTHLEHCSCSPCRWFGV